MTGKLVTWVYLRLKWRFTAALPCSIVSWPKDQSQALGPHEGCSKAYRMCCFSDSLKIAARNPEKSPCSQTSTFTLKHFTHWKYHFCATSPSEEPCVCATVGLPLTVILPLMERICRLSDTSTLSPPPTRHLYCLWLNQGLLRYENI